MNIEEMIGLFEMAAENVDCYDDSRIYTYQSRVRTLLDSIMTFETSPEKPLDAINKLESILEMLSEKIKMKENYELVVGQIKRL